MVTIEFLNSVRGDKPMYVEDGEPEQRKKIAVKLMELLKEGQAIFLIQGEETRRITGYDGLSGVNYLIRRNRPTIAFRVGADGKDTPLCALCLHPVAFYTDTWAGVLPPSDEVLAHLLMIRENEHYYWRKANQMPLEHENSGI